jgi:putative FmdB family regulatory protein
MPLFEYRCPACDSRFELLIRGDAVPTCPTCGGTSLERMLSLFAVSSADTQQKNRKSFGSQQRQKAEQVQRDRTEAKHDHHDD